MLFNAVYDSFDAIPEAYRSEFEQKNGKWHLKQDAIPGAAEILNPGLAANRDRALDQVKTKDTEIEGYKTTIANLERSQSVAQTPGSVLLSPEDAKTWDKYTKLGSIKEVEAIVKEHPNLKSKLSNIELTSSLSKTAADTGLNHEVLSEWVTTQPEGTQVEIFVKDETVDGKPVKKAYAKVSKKDASGTVTQTEHDVLTFAKETMPAWKFGALTTVDDKSTATGGGQLTTSPTGGVRVPKLGSATATAQTPTDDKRIVDKFNEARAQVPNPFEPVASAAPAK